MRTCAVSEITLISNEWILQCCIISFDSTTGILYIITKLEEAKYFDLCFASLDEMQWTKYILNYNFSSFLTIHFCSLLFKQEADGVAVK